MLNWLTPEVGRTLANRSPKRVWSNHYGEAAGTGSSAAGIFCLRSR